MLLHAISPEACPPPALPHFEARLIEALCSGGDARIRPDDSGRNPYHATVQPSDALAYGSSTINSISRHAFDTLLDHWHDQLDGPICDREYAETLAIFRSRLTEIFGQSDTCVVLASSGTDLEYVGLAAAYDGRPLTAVLLGRDEVGSGCIHSAAGRFFAGETATGARVTAQTPIDPIFADTELVDVPLRNADGRPRASYLVADDLASAAHHAIARGRRPVIHVVHGSKSGLTLPNLADIEALTVALGEKITIVVDACQMRITPEAVRRYLALGCVLMMTGSKFAGGPPFSGFALLPDAMRAKALRLPPGYGRIATRAEWPAEWPGAEALPASGNLGLLLRLQAAMVEVERFYALPSLQIDRIAVRFGRHVDQLMARLELREAAGESDSPLSAPCLAAKTLRTIDLSARWPACDFDAARTIHAHIARNSRRWLGHEIRLGQPVRTHCLPNGSPAGTLRLALSMPMMVEMAALDNASLDARFQRDTELIGAAITASIAAVESSRSAPFA